MNSKKLDSIMLIIDDDSETQEREILFVDKRWKEVIERLIDSEAVRKEVVKSYAKLRTAVDLDIEYAEELTKGVIALFTKHREELTKTYETEYQLTYELWETLDKKRYELRQRIEKVQEELRRGIQDDIKKLKQDIESCNIYGLDKLVEILRNFDQLPEASKQLFSAGIKHFTKEA